MEVRRISGERDKLVSDNERLAFESERAHSQYAKIQTSHDKTQEEMARLQASDLKHRLVFTFKSNIIFKNEHIILGGIGEDVRAVRKINSREQKSSDGIRTTSPGK